MVTKWSRRALPLTTRRQLFHALSTGGDAVIVVAQRLGHAQTIITNGIYAHALPSMQKDAAAKIASLLR